MRAYFFVNNLYMRELQWGLQSLHCLGELHNKYLPNVASATQYAMLRDWEQNHKTVIFLGAGNVEGLNTVYNHFRELERFTDFKYPFARFNEDEQSLNNAITSVGIILPESVYGLAAVMRDTKSDIDEWCDALVLANEAGRHLIVGSGIAVESRDQIMLADFLNQYRLA